MAKRTPTYIHTFEAHNKRAAEIVLPLLFSIVKPQSLLDVGCGLGTWLEVAGELGIADFKGIEGQHVDVAKLSIPLDDLIFHDLTQPIFLNRKYDIVICLEVAEHLPESASDILVKTLSDHSDLILFSAAVPGQGGQNHLNEKNLSYWSLKFGRMGYVLYDFVRPQIWNNKNVEVWYKQNMVVFCKGDYLEKELRPVSSPYIDIIHPDLFEFYSRQASRAAMYDEGKIGIRSSLASLLKSVRNKFI
ncbi:MAG: methyltransferase domain-containing protein [Bacteroidota bacterium]